MRACIGWRIIHISHLLHSDLILCVLSFSSSLSLASLATPPSFSSSPPRFIAPLCWIFTRQPNESESLKQTRGPETKQNTLKRGHYKIGAWAVMVRLVASWIQGHRTPPDRAVSRRDRRIWPSPSALVKPPPPGKFDSRKHSSHFSTNRFPDFLFRLGSPRKKSRK